MATLASYRWVAVRLRKPLPPRSSTRTRHGVGWSQRPKPSSGFDGEPMPMTGPLRTQRGSPGPQRGHDNPHDFLPAFLYHLESLQEMHCRFVLLVNELNLLFSKFQIPNSQVFSGWIHPCSLLLYHVQHRRLHHLQQHKVPATCLCTAGLEGCIILSTSSLPRNESTSIDLRF